MEKKAKNNEKKIIRRRTRLLKEEDMQVMREMGLEDVLEKISHIDTRDGIGLISAILLNAFMQKELLAGSSLQLEPPVFYWQLLDKNFTRSIC